MGETHTETGHPRPHADPEAEFTVWISMDQVIQIVHNRTLKQSHRFHTFAIHDKGFFFKYTMQVKLISTQPSSLWLQQ